MPHRVAQNAILCMILRITPMLIANVGLSAVAELLVTTQIVQSVRFNTICCSVAILKDASRVWEWKFVVDQY